jgi:hypothetical protein
MAQPSLRFLRLQLGCIFSCNGERNLAQHIIAKKAGGDNAARIRRAMEKKREPMNSDQPWRQAAELIESYDSDVFFFTRSNVLKVMEELKRNQKSEKILLLLVTYGGDPHAAFKIARYIQDKYKHFSLFVSGFCKSAGTLFAVAANEVIFAPFGELGPLDVQMAKPDHFQYDSGLVIGESLDTLERRAIEMFKRIFDEMISEKQGQISISTAMTAASELTKSIYAPIMSRIDPEEIGARQRALRIAHDYGRRLAIKSQNTTEKSLRLLAEKYSSHSFVIDKQEASELFQQVRFATEQEMHLARLLGPLSRFEQPEQREPIFTALGKQTYIDEKQEGSPDETAKPRGDSPANGADSQGTDGSSVSSAPNPRRARRGRSVASPAGNRRGSSKESQGGAAH